MNLFQGLKMAWKSISTNKMRSILTMLGIIIGVGAIIALVSIGQGATAQVTKEIQGMGTNLLTVNIFGSGKENDKGLSLAEAEELGKKPGAFAASPVIEGMVTAKRGDKNRNVSIEGVTPSYETVQNHHAQQGRFILPIDVQFRQKVALIGTQTARALFGSSNPIGEKILLNGIRYKIVGILQEKGSGGRYGSNDDKIMIPISSAERLLLTKGVRTVFLQAKSPEEVDSLKASVESDLQKRFRTKKNQSNEYGVFSQKEMLDSMKSVTGTLTLALGGIAGISLLVGGIGIMNIMLVSVSERTREIGIRKAIGARRRDIVLQFLIESMVLGGLGGLMGIVLGGGGALLVTKFTELEATPSLGIVMLAFGFAVGIGVFFGWFPANKASKLKPIVALKTD
ncbi:ABC transporter permease [Paenibacillus sp. KN14-4R]|uniref:ABC transporter permease n=1 Tax=Paenibacillus sp. KN14-4R TaxID=3445773 RepID=UPI003FA093B9